MSGHDVLAGLVGEFLAHKRSLGLVYRTPEFVLKRYLLFMEAEFPNTEVPDKASTSAFLGKLSGQQGGLHNAMSTLREFSRYLVRTGREGAYVIPPKQSPKLRPGPPYFFEEAELVAFFKACDRLYPVKPGAPCRGLVVSAQLRLLYCCGLRRKEATLLKRADVHLADRFLDIRGSKGLKDRRVFLSGELAEYLAGYDALVEEALPGRAHFFPKNAEDPYAPGFIWRHFKLVWRAAFPDWGDKREPRVHDLRHHFAWANINKWAREGADVNAMLPYLMRYMGHSHVRHTLYYFHFVPDFYPDFVMLAGQLDDVVPEVDHG